MNLHSAEHSYPSPSQPRAPASPRRHQSPHTTPQPHTWKRVAYRPPSPPSSDPSQCNKDKDGDISVEINLRDIAERAPEAKRIRRERRASSAGVWDLLGLPSCGYVYSDFDERQEGGGAEVRIVVWNGLSSFDEGMLN
ncbi:hypothetical protein BD779DRAFT_282180 [Infundibulicybe gibba]|nr:hypothetical protein BD779DRAFT_282180 [Infundibulicybe gibba]